MRILLLFLFLPVLAFAQNKSVACRMISFQSVEETDTLNCVAEGSSVACKFNKFDLSATQKLLAVNDVLSFSDSKTSKLACTVKVPAGVSQAILVFTSSKTATGLVWKGFLIEDSAKNIPNGGAFVVNLNSNNIRFVLGENKIMLKPGNQLALETPKQKDNFNMSFVAFEFMTKDQKWIKASENQMRFTAGLRYIMIAYSEPSSGTPRVATFQDKPFEPVKLD